MAAWPRIGRHLNVLNGLLAAAVTLAAFGVLSSVPDAPASSPLTQKTGPAAERRTPPAPPTGGTPADDALIAGRNLFHPSRTLPLEKPPEPPAARPALILLGTVLAGGEAYALLEEPQRSPLPGGRGRPQRTLRQGERLHGYLLSDVAADRIVLVRGEERWILRLDERAKGRERDRTPPVGPPLPP